MDRYCQRAVTLGLGLFVTATAVAGVTWQPAFSDEFNGTTLDTAKWNTLPRWGNDPINGELQIYQPGALSVSNGMLHITATKLTTPINFKGVDYWYQSGEIQSHQKFAQEYGKFEIRCQAPAGKGFWPAFWLLPEEIKWPPEIDVFEILGDSANQTQAHFGYIMPGSNGNISDGTWWSTPGYKITDFHTYAVEWDATRINWLVDGNLCWSSAKAGIPNEPMFLIVNLAVGGGWPGAPDAQTVFPSELTVDYVRTYTAVVPEPTALGLLALSGGVLAMRRKRK